MFQNYSKSEEFFFESGEVKILNEGKTLKIFTVGSKGHDQLKRAYGNEIIEKIIGRRNRDIDVITARAVFEKIIKISEK